MLALSAVPGLSALDVRGELAERLVGLLPGAHADTIERLAESARVRALKTGDVIYRRDEPVPLTLILHGFGVARRITSDGHELLSGVAFSGVVFGYSGIAGERSSVEIVAVTDGTVAQWPGSEVRSLVAADPGFALEAIDSMGASLHQTLERIEGFLHQNARRRVLRVLARHRDLFFGEPAVLDRTHLPGLVGTTREMTRRVLRKLEAEGTVKRVGASGLRLLRPERLEEG